MTFVALQPVPYTSHVRAPTTQSAEAAMAHRLVASVQNRGAAFVSQQPPHEAVLEDLERLVADHGKPGWDGDQAPGVSFAVREFAAEFIRALPETVPAPELAVDPDDGAISFEWRGGYRKVFSVSIGASGRLACAGLRGSDQWHAVLGFDGGRMPDDVVRSIRSVVD